MEVWPAIVLRSTTDPKDETSKKKGTKSEREQFLRSKLKRYMTERAKDAQNRSGDVVNVDDLIALWEVQNGLCALTGIHMTHTHMPENTNAHLTNASLDRIDSRKGYTLDNMQLVCRVANSMKYTLDEVTFVWMCNLICKQRQELIDQPPNLLPVQWYTKPRSESDRPRGVAKKDRR